MRINFGGFEDMETVDFYVEMWTGDHKQSGNQSMPKVFAQQQLNRIAYEILQDSAPRKMYAKTEFYDDDGNRCVSEKVITNKAWENSHEETD